MQNFSESFILSIIMLTFFMFLRSEHPLMVGCMVISQASLMASMLSQKALFSWFGYFIFIIYVGGILMIFSYIISLINPRKLMFLPSKMLVLPPLFMFALNTAKKYKSSFMASPKKFTKLIMSTFSVSSMKLTIFLMLFLFLIMVIVAFLSDKGKGNMRRKK